MIAQAFFLLAGYIIHFGLGRYLGPEAYGIFGVIISLITALNLLLISGMPRAVSKHIAEGERLANTIRNKALKIQGFFAFAVFVLYFFSAGVISNLLNDPNLEKYIRLSAFAIPSYAIYAIYTGYFNGLRYFGKQAKVMAFYSLAKILGVFALVFLGYAIKGAIGGFIIAPFIALMISIYYSRDGTRKRYDFKTEKIIRFAIPITIFSVASTLLMSLDLFAVKALTPKALANTLAGYYSAASIIARVPYFLITALAATLLPAISKSVSERDFKLTRRYINQSLRYSLMLLLPLSLLFSSTAKELVSLMYSSTYAAGGLPLSILALGIAFLSIFAVLGTIISASGKPGVSMSIILAVVLLDLGLNLFLVPLYQLMGAALATTLSSLFALILGVIYTLKRFKTLIKIGSFARIALSSMIIYTISLVVPISGVLLLVKYAILASVYVALLFALKEFKREDYKTLREIIPI